MRDRRVMLAAPKSGSGKTTITCALLAALKERGKQVISYKCGPDYIDPMFHEQVIGVAARNLDTFFTGEQETVRLFQQSRPAESFAVLEGVMGLFDGLGGIREEGSSYHLAKVTRTPVILVVDARGMGRSVLPLIAGFLAYDRERLIRGVILNRMSKSYYELLKPLIEKELGIEALGYVPERKDLQIESRHLGLFLPGEMADMRERIRKAAEMLNETVSLEAVIRIAEAAEPLEAIPAVETARGTAACGKAAEGEAAGGEATRGAAAGTVEGNSAAHPVIAVARDEAFCFYYKDNLELLEEMGAALRYFSPLHDSRLPEGCQGLLLGGGYPELYAGLLSENVRMREAVRAAFADGMPVVAECGGFLYLHRALTDQNGRTYAMAGVLPGSCSCQGKLVRFGYVEIREKERHFLPEGTGIRGHEFHYFDSTDNGEGCLAQKPATGRTYPAVIQGEHYWLGFPHLYYPSNPAFAKAFVEKAGEYGRRDKQ